MPSGPKVKIAPFDEEGAGSVPGQGVKTPRASQPKNQNMKQKLYCNKFNETYKKFVEICFLFCFIQTFTIILILPVDGQSLKYLLSGPGKAC